MWRWLWEIFKTEKNNPWEWGHLVFKTDMQWICRPSQGRNCSSVSVLIFRDMKPANLLMSKGVIKIGDFGFAKQNINKRIQNNSVVGTPLYMPLEILKTAPYTSKCDVWAVGFIFYEMLHGRTPWTAKTEYELVNNIETKPLIIDSHLKPNTRDFLLRSLRKSEQDRMSWDEVFIHPIF